MKFFVDVKDTSYATLEVEAESQEEAEKIAQTRYFEGDLVWLDSDLEIEAYPVEQERGDR